MIHIWNHKWIEYVHCQICTSSLTVMDSVSCCCGIGRSSIIPDISGPVVPLSPCSSLMKAANGSRAPSAGHFGAAWSGLKLASSWESGEPASHDPHHCRRQEILEVEGLQQPLEPLCLEQSRSICSFYVWNSYINQESDSQNDEFMR